MGDWMWQQQGPAHTMQQPSGPPAPFAVSNSMDQSPFGEEEKPLLEELGIDFSHVKRKARAVCNPFKPCTEPALVQDNDLAGPLFIALALGCALLLSGKVHFGYIYGFGMVGCLSFYALLNLMCERPVELQLTVSSLGYCLLPILFCSFLAFHFIPRTIAYIIASLFTAWAAWCATKIFEVGLDMREQRWLILYPLLLLYSTFTVISIF